MATAPAYTGPPFDVFSDAVNAGAAFLTAVGTYQLDQMKGLSLAIAAGGDLVRIQQQEVVLHQLQLTYHRLNVAEHETHAQLAVINRKVADAKMLLQGENLLWPPGGVNRCWTAIQYLMQNGSVAVLTKIYSDPLPSGALDPKSYTVPGKWVPGRYDKESNTWYPGSFVPVESPQTEGPTPTNAAMLIAWCSRNHRMPYRGSLPMLVILQAMEALATDAQARAADLKRAQADLETKTFTTWDPLKIDALPTNTAALAGAKV